MDIGKLEPPPPVPALPEARARGAQRTVRPLEELQPMAASYRFDTATAGILGELPLRVER